MEELKAIGEDLENISLELKKSTNQNRRISRHTSDISHRLGMRENFWCGLESILLQKFDVFECDKLCSNFLNKAQT